MLSRILRSTKPVKLGRWGTTMVSEKRDRDADRYLLSDLANCDSCGVCWTIAEDPEYYMTCDSDVIAIKKPR